MTEPSLDDLVGFAAGNGVAIVGPQFIALVLAGSDHPSTRALAAAADQDCSFDDALGKLGASGFAQLPGFVLATWTASLGRFVLRGPVVAEVHTGADDAAIHLVGEDVLTWAEHSVPGATSARLSARTVDATVELPFRVGRGTVPAHAVVVLASRFAGSSLGMVAPVDEAAPPPSPVSEVFPPPPAAEVFPPPPEPEVSPPPPEPEVFLPPPEPEVSPLPPVLLPPTAVPDPPVETGPLSEAEAEVEVDEPVGAPEPTDVESVELTAVEAVGLEDGGSPSGTDTIRPDFTDALSRFAPSVAAPASSPLDAPPPFPTAPPPVADDDIVSPLAPPPPDDDDYDSLFGATEFRSVEGAAVRPSELDQLPSPPEPDLAPAPPPTPASPAPPGDHDHDGFTVALQDLIGAVPDLAGGVEGQLAVQCLSGHLNPASGATCRVCGTDIQTQKPFKVDRIDLGVFRFSTGAQVRVLGPMLVGRAPKLGGEIKGVVPELVTVPSPEQDISRTHVEVRVEGWQVMVVDRDSTNGTFVSLPGQEPKRLRAGEPFPLPVGASVSLAGEVDFAFEVPE